MASKGTLVVRFIGDLKEFGKSFDKAQSKIGDFSKMAGAAGGAALTAGFLDAMGLDKANDKLAAQLGLTEKEAERVGKVASSLYAGAWGSSMDEVNSAVGAVMSSIDGMGKASSKELEGLTATALDFASAFDMDVQRAVSVAGTVINSGLAKNGTQAFDLLTAAAQRVPANLREGVLDAAEEYSQFFDALGIGGPEAFGLLVKGAEKGQFGLDKMGDAVKEFTIRATDLSEGTKDAFKAVGLNSGKMTNKILKGGDGAKKAFKKVVDGLLSMKDPGKQAEAAIALFGTPLEDLGVKEIPEFLKSLQGGDKAMKGFKGSAKDMGDTLNDNASTNIEAFIREVRTGFVDIVGGKVIPFIERWQHVLKPLAGVVATVGAVLATMAVATWAVTTAISAWTTVTKVASAVTKVWTGIQAAFNIVMAMNPVALVVLAVIALVAAFVIAYKKSETFRNIVNKALGAVRDFAVAAWEKIRDTALALWDWLVEKVGWAKDMLVKVFQNFTLVGLVIKHWGKIKKGTKKAWGAVVDFVKKIPKRLTGFFLNWTLPGLIIKHWGKIKKGTIRVASSIVDWVKGLPQRFVRGMATLGSLLLGTARSGFQQLREGAGEKVRSMLDWVSKLPGKIVDKLADIGEVMSDVGVNVVEGIWEGIKSMSDWLEDKVWDWVKSVLPGPVQKALGISSPSKVMRELAQEVPRGMALGLDDGSRQVARSAERMAALAVPKLTRPGVGMAQPASSGYGGARIEKGAIQVNMPATATPEAAAAAAGGRVVAELAAVGVG